MINTLQTSASQHLSSQNRLHFKHFQMRTTRGSQKRNQKIKFQQSLQNHSQMKMESTILPAEFSKSQCKQVEDVNIFLIKQVQKPLKKPRKKRVRRIFTRGPWSLEEHAKYYLFVISHKQQFQPTEDRRRKKLFQEMSRYITSRSPIQCRSHHQKQQQKQRSYQVFLTDLFNEVRNHPLLYGINASPIEEKIQNPVQLENKIEEITIIPPQLSQSPSIFTYYPDVSYLPINENQFYRLFPDKKLSDI